MENRKKEPTVRIRKNMDLSRMENISLDELFRLYVNECHLKKSYGSNYQRIHITDFLPLVMLFLCFYFLNPKSFILGCSSPNSGDISGKFEFHHKYM